MKTLLVTDAKVTGNTSSEVVDTKIKRKGKFEDGLPRTIAGRMGKVYVMFPAILKRGEYYSVSGTAVELSE